MISKIIHQTAPSDKTKWHPIWESCQNSWKDKFPSPEFSYMFWNDDDLLNLIEEHFPDYLQLYTDFGKNTIMKVDFARYAILYKYGGIYADMDFMCKKNFYSMLHNNLIIVESPAPSEIVQNSLMASPCHDARWLLVLEECKRYYYNFLVENPSITISGKYVIDITGPRLLSRALDVKSIQMLPKEQFNPYSNQFNSEKIYTKHYGTGKWGPTSGIKMFKELRDKDYDLKNIYDSSGSNYSIENIPEGFLVLDCGKSTFFKKNLPIPISLRNATFSLCNNQFKDILKIDFNNFKHCVTVERTDIRRGWGYHHNIYVQSNNVCDIEETNTDNNSFDIKDLLVYNVGNKQRFGKNGDGGYCILMQNDYDLLLSGGISYDTSFEEQFLSTFKNVECYAYDGSINNLPKNSNHRIKFHKKYIGGNNEDGYTNCHEVINNFNDIFVKMDIEGGEYDFFDSLDEIQMNKMKQIVLEVHFPNTLKRWKLLKKVAKTHYLIHVHGNNFNNKVSIKELENNSSRIRILPSTTNTKRVKLSVPIGGNNGFSLVNNDISEKFEFIMDPNDNRCLIVKRTDKNTGWEKEMWISINDNNIVKSYSDVLIPSVFECTYVRKSDFGFIDSLNSEALPCKLDMPNDAARKDVDLNYYPFVHMGNEIKNKHLK